MTLPEFLLARLAEGEDRAREQSAPDRTPTEADVVGVWIRNRWHPVCDPARVLADVEAKRRIVAIHTGDHKWCGEEIIMEPGRLCETLRLLALPYADHPDFRADWKVSA